MNRQQYVNIVRGVLSKLGYYAVKKEVKRYFFLRRIVREDNVLKAKVARAIQNHKVSPLVRKNDATDIIVSLTSYGERLSSVCPYAIYSLFTQSVRPNRICLFLDNSWNDNSLPPLIKALKELGLEVYYGDDLKSYKKLLPALRMFPDNPIITVDDDFYYNENLVKWLVDAFESRSDKRCVIGSWACVEQTKDETFAPYNTWPDAKCYKGDHQYSLKAGNGTLYAPHIFDEEICNWDRIMRLAPTADDLWFWAMERRLNVTIDIIPNAGYGLHRCVNRLMQYDAENVKDTLCYVNVYDDRNEQQFRRLVAEYNIKPYNDEV